MLSAGHRGDADSAAAYLDDPDPVVRATAIGALARSRALRAAVLATMAADDDATVRRRACEEAGRLLGSGTPAPGTGEGPALVAVLLGALDDPDDAVVEAAAWATGEAGGGAAGSVEALCRVAEGHGSALCREAAVAALGAVGDGRALETVLGALGDKPAVRRRAAQALAAFEGPRVEEGLRRCLEDRDWQVRQAAEELLGRD